MYISSLPSLSPPSSTVSGWLAILLERPVALADAPKEDAQSRDLGCERGALEYLIGVASLETVPTVALPHVRRRQMRKGR